MQRSLVQWLLILIVVILQTKSGKSLDTDRRTGTFLNIFTVVNFANGACNTTVNNKTGICYSPPECSKRKGVASGTCADGFGVCCLFESSCDGSSSNNGTHFLSPQSPGTYNQARTCQITITKLNRNVCQYRLDFLLFRLRPPVEGTCSMDRLVVSGQNQNSIVPPICGMNTGQHMYVEVTGTEGPITLTVITLGDFNRQFDIKVTQVSCTSMIRAPSNCLQYFTGVQGNIKSFNYNFDSRFVQVPGQQGNAPVDGYFNDLDYSMCFRKEAGFCSITYTVANTTVPSTGNNQPTPSFAIRQGDGTAQVAATAGAGPTDCITDYLILANTRLCGGRLNGDLQGQPTTNADIVDMTSGPFIARFITDKMNNERGFDLQYRQNPCTTAGK